MRSVIVYLIPWFADHARSSLQSQRRASTGKQSGSNGERNSHRSVNEHRAANGKYNLDTMNLVEDGDTASLSSGEVMTVEKVERAGDVEVAAPYTMHGK